MGEDSKFVRRFTISCDKNSRLFDIDEIDGLEAPKAPQVALKCLPLVILGSTDHLAPSAGFQRNFLRKILESALRQQCIASTSGIHEQPAVPLKPLNHRFHRYRADGCFCHMILYMTWISLTNFESAPTCSAFFEKYVFLSNLISKHRMVTYTPVSYTHLTLPTICSV